MRETPKTKSLKRRRPWRIVKWLTLFLILGLVIALTYAWTHRLEFLETQVSKILKDKGYDTTFEIEAITKKRAVLRDITVGTAEGDRSSESSPATPFLTAKKVTLNYEWREALEGNIEQLSIEGPHLFGELDSDGKLISPIFPKSGTDTTPILLPEDGIVVKNGSVTLKNVAGRIDFSLDAALNSFEDWTADVTSLSGVLSIGDVLIEPEGRASITVKENIISARPELSFARIKTPQFNLKEGFLSGTLNVDPISDDLNIQSNIGLKFQDLNLPDYAFEDGDIKWDGQIKATRESAEADYTLSTISGEWDADIEKFAVSNPQRRTDLTNLITLNKTLAKTPMVKNFANIPNAALKRLLSGAGVTGQGDIAYTSAGYQIGLGTPLILKSKIDTLEIKPISGQSSEGESLVYDRVSQDIQAKVNVVLGGPSALSLTNMYILAGSPDGISLSGVKDVSANLSLLKPWSSKTEDGKPARLGAFSASLKYIARQTDRNFTLNGPIEYDGDIPGGYVTGLSLDGTTRVNSKSDRVETRFMPVAGSDVTLSKFENPTDWRGENLKFKISDDGALYVLRQNVGRLTTDLVAMTADLVDKAEARHLAVDVAKLAIVGTVSDNLQNWRMIATESAITSPDIPEGGSKTVSPTADMVFRLRPDQSPEFTIKSLETEVKTNTVSARNMSLEIKGTPTEFNMDYSDGWVKFSTDDLPELPFEGQVQYKVEPRSNTPSVSVWTGTAQTFLPKAEVTPIRVSYTYSDGQGSADVLIDELIFKPGKLQPQTYVKALKGKVSQVDGTVSAALKLEFSPNEPLKSSGSASLKNLGMGTLTGPFTGINAELNFSSMFPLQSVGRQKVTARLFDPGFPLEDGVFEFEIIPDGIRLYSAVWPVGQGTISIDPTDWNYAAAQNNVTMRLENISVQEFTESVGNKSFRATGILEGVLPVVIEGVKTEVVGGVLRVKDGGMIKFQTPQTDAAGAKNELAATAFDALKEFEYKKLEAYLDGPLDGNLIIKMEFDGKNKDVLGGAVFAWDVTVEGELINIARSFSPEKMNQTYKNMALESLKNSKTDKE